MLELDEETLELLGHGAQEGFDRQIKKLAFLKELDSEKHRQRSAYRRWKLGKASDRYLDCKICDERFVCRTSNQKTCSAGCAFINSANASRIRNKKRYHLDKEYRDKQINRVNKRTMERYHSDPEFRRKFIESVARYKRKKSNSTAFKPAICLECKKEYIKQRNNQKYCSRRCKDR